LRCSPSSDCEYTYNLEDVVEISADHYCMWKYFSISTYPVTTNAQGKIVALTTPPMSLGWAVEIDFAIRPTPPVLQIDTTVPFYYQFNLGVINQLSKQFLMPRTWNVNVCDFRFALIDPED